MLTNAIVAAAQHDTILELFRTRPSLGAELPRDLHGVTLPRGITGRVREASESFEELETPQYRGDQVVLLGGKGDAPCLVVLVEVQRMRKNAKRRRWLLYVASLVARHGCPVFLLVIATSNHVARWCRKPIVVGHPGLVLTPLVVGPDTMPVIDDPAEAAANVERAALSAVAHSSSSNALPTAKALAQAVVSGALESRYLYIDLVVSMLRRDDRRELEDWMNETHEYRSSYFRGLIAKGKAEGKAEDIVTVLKTRGVRVDADAVAKIRSCRDLATLDRWLRRATEVTSVEALFAR